MTKKTLVLDLETSSLIDLKKEGTDNYAADGSTFITMIAFSELGSDKTHCVVNDEINTSNPNKTEAVVVLEDLYANPDKYKLICHNHYFERTIIEHCFYSFIGGLRGHETTKHEFDVSQIEWVDTMTLSNIFRGPAGLDVSARFFKVSKNKDGFGKSLMKKVSKLERDKNPDKKTTTLKVPTTWTDLGNNTYLRWGEEIEKHMVDYCIKDVEVTKELYKKFSSKQMNADLGDFKKHIIEGIRTTNEMNYWGVMVDMDWLAKLNDARLVIEKKFNDVAKKYFRVDKGAQRSKIIKFLNSKGYKIEKLGKKDIKRAIETQLESTLYNKALGLYSKYNKTSLNKVDNALYSQHGCCLYDMFRFCGAYTTGRWTSYGVQLQNLPRPTLSVDEVKEFVKKPVEEMANDPDAVVSAIRAALVPRHGKKFFVADLSQIEARRGLEFGGYSDILKKMAKGYCIYTDMAATIYNKKYEYINKDSTERQVGKVAILSLQYGTGATKFKDTLKDQAGVTVSQAEAKRIVDTYRNKYSSTVKLWKKYDNQLNEAVYAGKTFRVKLATGRYLNYGAPKLRPTVINGKKVMKPHYYDGQMWKALWGGTIYQNVIQAECRDIMLLKMNWMNKMGYRILMTVHDEVIIEVPESEELEVIECEWNRAARVEINSYFPNLPIASDCVILDRYYSH